MNIVMLTSDYLPNIGGLSSHIYQISEALQSLGNSVCIIHVSESDVSNISISDISEYEGINTIRAKYPKHSPKGKILFRTYAAYKAIKKYKNYEGVLDILHSHDFLNTSVISCLISFSSTWVWTNHTSGFLKLYDRTSLRRSAVKFLHKRADGIVAVSRELREKTLNMLGNSEVKFIPNGVDLDKFDKNKNVDKSKFGVSDNEFVVLCPRRMVPKNGVKYLAQSINILNDRGLNNKWHFIFLGSTPDANTDLEYIESIKNNLSHINGKIKASFMGNIEYELMPEINLASDVVVIPSLMEAVSLSALEAMATARPVIATNVGGLPEVIHHHDTGLLVEPRDPEALADALQKLYENNDLRSKISTNGYSLVREEYSWESIARKTISFYKKVG